MNSDISILTFLGNLEGGDFSSTAAVIKNIDKTTQDILKEEEKAAKQHKREAKKDESHKRRLAQMAKRKEREDEKAAGQGILSKLFKGKEKKEGDNMAKLFLAGIGVAAAGTWLATSQDPTARKIREEIGKKIKEGVEFLKPKIQEAINAAFTQLKRALEDWADDLNRKDPIVDKKEIEIEKAPGTIDEKINKMLQQKKELSWIDNLFNVGKELDEAIYRLQSGETMSYARNFRKGGSAGSQGRGIVSGDLTRLLGSTTGENQKQIRKLDKLIRDRRKLNDDLAAATTDNETQELGERIRLMDSEIGGLLRENEELTKEILRYRDLRIKRANHPVQRQAGGPIIVPGYGDGDKIPMLLPEGAFVLNREASKQFRFQEGGVVGRQQGGPVYGEEHLMNYARQNGIKGKELASFMGQMAHESGNFRYAEEIDPGHKYEGREILGNTQPGDGPLFKGRGYIQLTGRWNYTHFGKKLGLDLANKPELAAEPNNAARIAVEFWKSKVNRNAARSGDVRGTTYNINPGYKGLKDRIAKTEKYMADPRIHLQGPAKVGPKIMGQKIVGTGNPLVDKFREMTGQSAPVGTVIKKQVGGVVSNQTTRMEDNHAKLLEEIARNVEPTTVVVKRRARQNPLPQSNGPSMGGSRSELNIVEMKSKLHRLSTGSNY